MRSFALRERSHTSAEFGLRTHPHPTGSAAVTSQRVALCVRQTDTQDPLADQLSSSSPLLSFLRGESCGKDLARRPVCGLFLNPRAKSRLHSTVRHFEASHLACQEVSHQPMSFRRIDRTYMYHVQVVEGACKFSTAQCKGRNCSHIYSPPMRDLPYQSDLLRLRVLHRENTIAHRPRKEPNGRARQTSAINGLAHLLALLSSACLSTSATASFPF